MLHKSLKTVRNSQTSANLTKFLVDKISKNLKKISQALAETIDGSISRMLKSELDNFIDIESKVPRSGNIHVIKKENKALQEKGKFKFS